MSAKVPSPHSIFSLFKELLQHKIKEIASIVVNYSREIWKVSTIYKYLHHWLNFVKKRLQKWQLN